MLDSSPLTIPTTPALDSLRTRFPDAKFLVVSFARGHWCPFCRTFASVLQKNRGSIEALGGRIVVASSQLGNLIPTDWAKPTATFKEPFTLDFFEDSDASLGAHLGVVLEACADSSKHGQYKDPNSMTQPGVFVLRPSSDGSQWDVLVRWVHVSKASNIYGAIGRPDVNELISATQTAMAAETKTAPITLVKRQAGMHVWNVLPKKIWDVVSSVFW